MGFESLHAELNMMMRTGDLNPNQFGDSMKETVKRTMLHHEIVFREQVRELHRLYWTQKNLMRELYRKETEVIRPKEGNVVSLEEFKGKGLNLSENRHISFNPQLPSAVYTVESVKNSIATEKLLIASEIFRSQCGARKAAIDKGKNLYCHEVIDLGDPVDAHGVSFNSFKVPAENCGAMGSFLAEIASDMASSSRIRNECGFVPYTSKKESGFVPDLNRSNKDCNEGWQEHKTDQSVVGGSESSVAGLVDVSADSTNKKEPNSSKPMLIDLNIPQYDESSCPLNDPTLAFSSPSSSSSVLQTELFWRDQVNKHPKQTSAPNSNPLHSQMSKVSDFAIKEHEAGDKVQGSNSTGLTECCRNSMERLTSGDRNTTRNDKMQTLIKEDEQANPMETEETPSSDKPTDEQSETTQSESLIVESSPEKSCKYGQDCADIDAAEILAGISLTQSSSSWQQQPQYSTDTYEAMMLELPEVRSDMHLTTPTEKIVAGDAGEGASGVSKLRRGRGRVIRDFQKDILPGIVSLSRHEICEDMHSIGYKLQKNRSRKAGGSWFLPVRSKRSRRYPVRQRN